MSFGSDPQDFVQYALSLPDNISDDSSHESESFEPYTDSNSEIDSNASDMESNASNDASDTSEVASWDEIIRRADPRYRHRFLRHMMDYYTNPDPDVGPFDYSDSEFNYSHDSLVNSAHSSDSFHSAHSSIAGSELGRSSHDNGSESSPEPPDYMGPDGRLLESERERRRNLSLCFYCGGDHFRSHCPKLRAKYLGASDASQSDFSEEAFDPDFDRDLSD
ncbi:hypothetical protein GGU10DRAFT_381134 [Lentinula aff. detonsa]|uniref:Uncharacterized protein n=1 Tax=Lentinula aff. detonsa TaxID=2804958 RepID=A0AA38KMV7_9AGAR|nr:hypothetical protein GGU10DRAFT_381134 [Lentinula aff. detonsa]